MYPEPGKPSRPAIVGLLYLGGVFALLFGVTPAIFGPFERLTGIVIAVDRKPLRPDALRHSTGV